MLQDTQRTSAPSSTTDDTTKYLVSVTEGFEPPSATGVDASDIMPQSIKFAALLLVGQYYDNRQAINGNFTTMDFGLHYLLDPYKANYFI